MLDIGANASGLECWILTFRLKEEGAFGRRGGEEKRFSAFPFLLVDLQMCRTSENQNTSL